MNLKCETILEFYTHKNKQIFCQIKVLPSKSLKIKNTCRSLTSDQWNTFDKELEKLLDGMKQSEDGDKEKLGKFVIEPNIEVKVKKSKLSLNCFCKLLPLSEDSQKDVWRNSENIAVVLECMLDLEHKAIFSISNNSQEYEPQLKTSSADGKLSSYLTYEPYTPSKTKYSSDFIVTVKTPGIDLLNYNEDTYSPKPLFKTNATQSFDEIIPKYKPAPIKENINSKNNNIVETQKSKEEYIPEAQKISTLDIPDYVPTPIECSSAKKEIKLLHERHNVKFENNKLRRRSKTVDVMSKDLSINQKTKLSATNSVEPLNENILKYKPTYIGETCCSQDSENFEDECSNEVINETDDENVPLQNCRSLKLISKKNIRDESYTKTKSKELLVKDMQTNICINKDTIIANKHLSDIDADLPECHKKNIIKRSKTLDSMPEEIKTKNEKLKLNKISEEDKKIVFSDFNKSKSREKKNELKKIYKTANSEEKIKKLFNSTSSSGDEDFAELSKRPKKNTITHSKESDNDFEDVKKFNKKKCLSSPETNATDCASQIADFRKSRNTEQPNTASLRRSDRSPNKPKRFIEEISGVDPSRQKKTKKIKTSTKSRELFGSDYDDDDVDGENGNDFETIKAATQLETPIRKNSIKSSSSSSSAKKKRKGDGISDCEQEKRDINKWLSKKKTSIPHPEAATSQASKKSERSKSPLTKPSKKSKSSKKASDINEVCSKSVTTACENFDMPSKKELEEIRNKSKLKQKENEKLKAELDKMRATPPKEVENLSLQGMSANDILDTFSTYKSELDEIYKKNCKRDYIKGHDGINHCFVIQLLQQNVQMKMLQKLTDVYSNSNNAMQATLYANALLPEWIIRVYMDKFNFTRQEAIHQIKAQDDYRLHLEEQNDGSFMFN